MVDPVPDGSAAEEVRRLDGIPVVLQVAHGVAHGVSIFRNVERILDVHLSLDGLAHPAHTGILVAAHVDNVVVALILNRTRGVEGFQGIVAGLEVVARSGLVAQTPDDDARVVHMGVGQFHHTSDVCRLPFHGVGERCIAIVILMTLQIGLAFKIDAVFVTEVVEIGIVGIMRGANVVDVGALHHHHLFLHLLARNGMTAFGIRLMTVHTLQLQRLAINKEIPAREEELVVGVLHILDFNRSEAYLCRYGFGGIALQVAQLSHQHVDIRLLGCPRLDGHQGKNLSRCCRSGYEFIFVGIEFVLVEAVLYVIAHLKACVVLHERLGFQRSLPAVPLCCDSHVLNMHLRCGVDAHTPEDARQTEHVLSLKERAVAVAIYLNCNRVQAHLGIVCDVETGSIARVLRESNVLAINPKIEERVYTVELYKQLLAFPFLGNRECAYVRTHLVTVLEGGPVGGWCAHHAFTPVVLLHLVVEDDGLVNVDGRAVFLRTILLQAHDVPAGGHGNVIP